jgi:uncharacterized protein YaaR (DUF327 family)
MSEEPTDRLEGNTPFETRVLRELANLNKRLASLEEKVDSRLRETRPIWEAMLSRVETIDSKLDVLAKDLLETRADTELLKKRLPPAA